MKELNEDNHYKKITILFNSYNPNLLKYMIDNQLITQIDVIKYINHNI